MSTPIKLSELTSKIRQILDHHFGAGFYWVIAEISGHKYYPNADRHYFDFIEKPEGAPAETAKVKGIAWSSGSQNIKLFEQSTGQKFGQGLQVLAKVKVEFHALYGLQLILQDIDPSFTLGNLEKQRRDTLLKLVSENPGFIQKSGEEFVTANKQLKMGMVLQHIALLASPNSEGHSDFMHTLQSNQYGYQFQVDLYASSVQGTDAGQQLLGRMEEIQASGKKYDCLVIIRGGGAKTDFLVFDMYHLARAAACFPVPIITGIGHHKDVSIVDLMVHTSTKTPTQAAEFIILHARNYEDSVLQAQKSIIIRTQQLIGKSQNRIHGINNLLMNKTQQIVYNRKKNLIHLCNTISSIPLHSIRNKINDLHMVRRDLHRSSGSYIRNQQSELSHYASLINLMSPQSILNKGFAMISKDGRLIKDASAVKIGSDINIIFSKTIIGSTVHSKTKRHGNSPDV